MKRTTLLVFVSVLAGCSGKSPSSPSAQIPNVQGQWSGSYVTQSCLETGSAAGAFCSSGRGGGGSGALTLTLTQSESTLTGTLRLGSFTMPTNGSVNAGGVVVLAGSGTLVDGFISTLDTWRTTVAGNTMSGTFGFTIVGGPPAVSTPGTATVSAALQGVTKT